MKSFLSCLGLLLALAGAAPATSLPPTTRPASAPARPTETVYVCMSKGSVAYHSSDACAGLNRCSHPIKPMSAADAQKLGKRACQKCY